MANTPPEIFPPEPSAEALARLVQDFNSVIGGGRYWNSRPGGLIHAIFQSVAQDSVKVLDLGQFAFSLGFLEFAQGAYLDAKALEFGVVRHTAVPSTVEITFIGEVGTVIPSGQAVATEGTSTTNSVVFITQSGGVIGLDGELILLATAEVPGSSGNVASGDVSILVDSLLGVFSVYNEQPGTGGVDVQDEESLREEAIQRALSIPKGGNKDTLFATALLDSEVSSVLVKDFWDTTNGLLGNGSVLVVVGGQTFSYVSPASVERVQQTLDPTIKNLAHFEDETWSNTVDETVLVIEGKASKRVTTTAGGSKQCVHTYLLPYNLSAWNHDEDEVWLWVRRVSAASTVSSIKIRLNSTVSDYFEYTISGATLDGATGIATSGGALLKMELGSFTSTGSPSMLNVTSLRIEVIAVAAVVADVVLDGMRIVRKYGGFPSGTAPVFVQVTVRSARALITNVVFSATLVAGGELAAAQSEVELALSTLFDAKNPGKTLLLSEVANAIYDTTAIEDYSGLTLNGDAANLSVADDQRPVLGAVTINVV